MIALSDTDWIDIWESGLERPSALRALAILRAGCPELTTERLGALTLGERDIALLTLRSLAFGRHLDCVGRCRACAQVVELRVDGGQLVDQLRASIDGGDSLRQLDEDGYRIELRRLSVSDSCALAGIEEPESLRAALFARCICHAWRGEESLDSARLPMAIYAAIENMLERWDPAALVGFDVQCPSCTTDIALDLDIASFFWSELEAKARSLIGQVHMLASSYGWSEAAILAMSPRRRREYLARIES